MTDFSWGAGIMFFLATVLLAANFLMVGYMIVGMFRKDKAAPYVSSFNKEIRLMKETLHLIKGKSMVDLGCGDGKALRFFAKEFGIHGVGYDINIYAIILGSILNRWLGFRDSVQIYKKNFLKVDLSKFDYIYVYLLPHQLADIEDWIWKNMKKDAIIIANSFKFSKHEPYEVIKNKKGKPSIFLYKK